MSRTKKIAILAIIAMVLTMLPVSLFAADDVDRLAGADRISTAIAIADEGWSTADTVILAPADQANLVDALAAAPLAGQENAPILLTFKNALNANVKAKIEALGASKVYVVGAISNDVVAAVNAIDGVTAEKLSGADRWATADAINAKLVNPAGSFVVGYNALPDALSVASYAAANNFAIVLTKADGTVDASKLVGSTTYLVGGTSVVKDYEGATRLSGADRFATNAAVAAGLSFSYGEVYVANGISLVDALAVAPLAAKADAFVALTNGTDVAAASTVNEKLSVSSKVIAVGGTSAVSDAVAAKLGFSSTVPTVAAVTVASYDDDTANQFVAFTVNGKPASVSALNADGWDVEFVSYDNKSGAGAPNTDTYFDDATSGLLKKTLSLLTGDIYVQVILTKGVDVITSDLAKITIKNLNVTATGIDSYKLTNNTGSFEQESTTLNINENATFTEITIVNGSTKEKITTGFTLTTSDPSVISRDNSTLTITAQAPGTATVTINYGGASKAITFKVVNDTREISKIRAKSVSKNTVITSVRFATATQDVKVEALDQFGDPVPGGIDTVESSNEGVVTVAYAEPTLTLTKVSAGTSTISFKDATGTKIGSLPVTTSNNTSVAKKVFELWTPATDVQAAAEVVGATKSDFSADATIDYAEDQFVAYQVTMQNSDGDFLGLDTVTVDAIESTPGVIAANPPVVTANNRVIVGAAKAGTVTLKVTDSSGKLNTVKITVVDTSYSIKSVSFKALASSPYPREYTWKSIFNYTTTGNDPIITGITLNKPASQAIRYDEGIGLLYIDKDPDGGYDGGVDDVPLGTLELFAVGTVGGTTDASLGLSVTTATGDDGTLVFKIWNPALTKVLASTSVQVEL